MLTVNAQPVIQTQDGKQEGLPENVIIIFCSRYMSGVSDTAVLKTITCDFR